MDMQRIYNVLTDAEWAVKNQQQEIERLRPKAQAYDYIGKLLGPISSGDQPNPLGVDPVWMLGEAAKEVRAELDRIEAERETEYIKAEQETERSSLVQQASDAYHRSMTFEEFAAALDKLRSEVRNQ